MLMIVKEPNKWTLLLLFLLWRTELGEYPRRWLEVLIHFNKQVGIVIFVVNKAVQCMCVSILHLKYSKAKVF